MHPTGLPSAVPCLVSLSFWPTFLSPLSPPRATWPPPHPGTPGPQPDPHLRRGLEDILSPRPAARVDAHSRPLAPSRARVPWLLSRCLKDPAGPKSLRPAAPVLAGGGHSLPAGQTPFSRSLSTRSPRQSIHYSATRRPASAAYSVPSATSTPPPDSGAGQAAAYSPVRLRGGSAAAREGDYTSRRALRPEEGPALAPPRKIRRLAGAAFPLLAALGSR
ncbi:MAPK-interacting and spindle-stabilizing protein-like [Ictidomys tridecemlineatus]|nr:MAPK-interacting and spindle-stabilizing protein-like [Ictidomys tridecemlineatus]